MQNKRQQGQHYERLAVDYLTSQALNIIECNFHSRYGEIDIIASENKPKAPLFSNLTAHQQNNYQPCFVFIEVKYRKNANYGHATEMVTSTKQQKIIKTAMLWLKKQRLSVEHTQFRFDIIAIENGGQYIEWIKNAITN